ncbi:MAG: PAS domain S-box protein [Deltaproteobacteria bacterium]|nr:PAS domain S-box protein [Deltaproteobacteria bacterium]
MTDKPSYAELKNRIELLNQEARILRKTDGLLQVSEKKYRTVFDSSPDAILIVHGITGEIIDANQTLCKILGYDVNSLMGKHFEILFHYVENFSKEELLDKINIGDAIFNIDCQAADHTVFPMELTARMIPWVNGQAIIVTLRDVSERRKVEDALEEDRQVLIALGDSAKDAILMMDNEGRVSYMNKSALGMFGYSKEEIIGMPLHETLASPEYAGDYTRGFHHFKTTGQGPAIGKSIEVTALHKDGTVIPIELSLSAVKIRGCWHAIGILRDIYERKQAEEERMRGKKLVGVLEMAGAICHELNQPLHVIGGYSELLQLKMDENDPLYPKLKSITEQVAKLGEITAKLSKITTYETREYIGGKKIIDIDKSAKTSGHP